MKPSNPVGTDSKKSRPRLRLRWFVILGSLVTLVGIGLLLLPRLVDVERFRGRIDQALREQTGWNPEIGEIRFSVLRGLVLAVSPARLEAPEGGSSFEIDSLEVHARLGPLLGGKLEVQSIVLRRPRIELVRKSAADGWIVPELPTTASAEAAPKTPPNSITSITTEIR